MASDYKRITKKHKEDYGTAKSHLRVYTQLYSDKTHFVYELVQNADDNKSRHMELQLGENELLVWNDGGQFSEKDVLSICSIGLSNKDLTQIGTFGIGFKAVYNYTDLPEIYSGDERFRIRDLTKPEGIDIDDMASRVIELVDRGRTVFRLPFKERLRQEDIVKLKKRLCDLEKRALLFLHHLETVQWYDEQDKQMGSYFSRRCLYDKIQNVYQVEVNGDDQPPETFLIFRKDVQPPKDVINELLQQAEYDEERQRIQRSATKQQPIEVAFKLLDGQITAMDSCVLFSYLPTEKETHLRFLIQARYQTTPARDNIPPDNLWNKWLVKETANFLPNVLEQLKAGGLLKPAFFDVLPIEADSVPAVFGPIAEASRKAMRKGAFVPTQNERYAKADSVFYPHTDSLRQLVECGWLYPDSSWLHPEIRDTEEFRRCFKVMREAGVREVSVSQMLRWLEKQSLDWFKGRCDSWLRSLYAYLNRQKSELERIKKLPLVRLENGRHVYGNDQLVFFPPDTGEAREEIKPFLGELPIFRSALLEGDERNDIEAFLKDLGVSPLRPEDMIYKWILPQYSKTDKLSVEQNRLHVRYIFKIWDKIPEAERKNLREEIGNTPILQTYCGVEREVCQFVKPCDAYMPEAYTGDADLETYFSVCDDVWFVDGGYMDSNANPKNWLRFLKEIGTMDTPRVIKQSFPLNDENRHELDARNLKREPNTGKETIEDSDIHGLEKVLARISNHREVGLSQVLWRLLVKVILSDYRRTGFFQGTYSWYYYKNQSKPFDAIFYRQLKEAPWLPDEQGNLHLPAQCFEPTRENRRVLGDSVAYLHPDFDLSDEPVKWLAEKLTVHRNANTESVLNYLQTLSGSTKVSIKNVKPLYRFLERQGARPHEKFGEEALIFTPNPQPRWWKTDEVFWEDEGHLFDNDRGYLKTYYAETLKPFFTALRVSEQASFLDYVRGIQQVTSGERADDENVRKRIKILYRRLWQSLQEGSSGQWEEKWNQTRNGKCWLGKKGNEWGFFFLQELVWKDHDYLARLFEGEVPFWVFDDGLLELAKYLNVEGCSRAEVEFDPEGDQEKVEDWSAKVRNLHPYIHAFLESPRLCEKVKSDQVLDQLSVRSVKELSMTYKLKGISVSDPNPRQSFLDTTGQDAKLWLGLGADECEYAELIGDALQDHFDVKELRGFVEDLLTKNRDKVTARWKQRGLRADFCVSSSEPDSKEGEETPTETHSGTEDGSADPTTDGTEPENPLGGENTETGSRDSDSTGGISDEPLPSTNSESQGGHWPKASGSSKGGHGGRGGGGEGEQHKKLKKKLANNPSQLGEGLKLVEIEHTFQSKDRVDILLKDSVGNPVTVEVETHIQSENYVGVWQAVKYKHLAAVEYGLSCDQVRSVLVAPGIPDDVKEECKKFGIEPKEVKM